MYVNKNDLFHIHTYRCGHAEEISDEEYIKKGISIGATGIWFTDHAPFPGNPFGNRMMYEELDEYIKSLSVLKERYSDCIGVHIGLEIEYFPSFDKQGYYKELKSKDGIELLLLGQHMAEISPNHYSFEWSEEQLNQEEYFVLGNAQIQGMKSHYFDAIAHPDRIFKRKRNWTADMSFMAEQIIDTAIDLNIPLEINKASKHQKYHFWKEFWKNVNKESIIYGLDAHSIKELQ